MGNLYDSKDGWKDIQIEDNVQIPKGVTNYEDFYNYLKISQYIDEHPLNLYTILDEQGEVLTVVKCTTSTFFAEKQLNKYGITSKEHKEEIKKRISYFKSLTGIKSGLARKWRQGIVIGKGSVLQHRETELLELFGTLHTKDEIHKIITQEWGWGGISPKTINDFYSKNLTKIDLLRNEYANKVDDLVLTKKRGRLDKLSTIFYVNYQRFEDTKKIDYSRESRACLEQIRKELEGERISLDISGNIDISMSIQASRTIQDVTNIIPINMMVLSLVAGKQGIDPKNIISRLSNSYYSNLNGYSTSKVDDNETVINISTANMDWDLIKRKLANEEKNKKAQEVDFYEVTEIEKAQAETTKEKMIRLLKERQEDLKSRI